MRSPPTDARYLAHDPNGFASKFGFHTMDSYEDGLEWLLNGDNWMSKGERSRK
ncbi:hypothetical protein HOB36_08525 [Candidatus Bathyarchaeota archaeon]|nr:hypothetical protein [Candidatus Bathyarchaeota archaeon]